MIKTKSKTFLKLKQITRKFTPNHTTIRNEDERFLIDNDNKKERKINYCRKLFEDETGGSIDNTEAPSFDLELDTVTIQEVQAALAKVKSNKASRENNIVIEMITSIGETGTKMIFTICKQIWLFCKWSSD